MSRYSRPSAASGSGRGQTTLDFAVGMSVFLLTVIFVISFAPTMFDPFAGGSGTKLIVADRAATTLSGDLLVASTAEPGTLSAGCVAGFFDSDQSRVENECTATIEAVDDLDRTLALDGRNANVTVHSLADSASKPATVSGVKLTEATGSSVPSDVAVATRTVSIDGEQYRLTVRVW